MDRADVKILPPVILLLGLGAGIAAGAASSAALPPSPAAKAAGVMSILAAGAIAGLAFRALERASTSFDVRRSTLTLVTTGVFAVSRNPVYFAMVLLQVGIALLIDSAGALLFVVPTANALCRLAIKPEERYLEQKFGEAYRVYRDRTPRWL